MEMDERDLSLLLTVMQKMTLNELNYAFHKANN